MTLCMALPLSVRAKLVGIQGNNYDINDIFMREINGENAADPKRL